MKNTEYLSNGMGGIVLSAKEAQDVLRTSPAYEEYLSLTEDFRREILDIVRGAKGLRITYDPFFKHVFDPVLHGERLSRLLTVIIGQQVTVKQVLPSQFKRLTAEASLIIMDIVVELESGALANLLYILIKGVRVTLIQIVNMTLLYIRKIKVFVVQAGTADTFWIILIPEFIKNVVMHIVEICLPLRLFSQDLISANWRFARCDRNIDTLLVAMHMLQH